MASTVTAAKRRRGSVRPHYGQSQARVAAGIDPVTGERIILHETVATEREAEKALTRLLAEADALKTARTKASFGDLLDAWFPQHEPLRAYVELKIGADVCHWIEEQREAEPNPGRRPLARRLQELAGRRIDPVTLTRWCPASFQEDS